MIAVSSALAAGVAVAPAGAQVAPDGWAHAKQVAALTAPDGSGTDWFGDSVSLSADGETAVVGAYYLNSVTGAAYVFTHVSGKWKLAAELTASDGKPESGFGWSVAISPDGSTILVGALFKDDLTGAVYVFSNSDGDWTQTAEVEAADPGGPGTSFGMSVAISGADNVIAVGADAGTIEGRIYVFRDVRGTWDQKYEFSESGIGDGTSVAISTDGKTVAAGAYYYADQTGEVLVFTGGRHGWQESAEITASDGVTEDDFGQSVALSGSAKTLVVGAPEKNDHGGVYVFAHQKSGWVESAQLTARLKPWASFGCSVTTGERGRLIAVGASGVGQDVGSAYVFHRGAKGWRMLSKLRHTPSQANDYFGWDISVSANGAAIFVGGPGFSEHQGHAFAYAQKTGQQQWGRAA